MRTGLILLTIAPGLLLTASWADDKPAKNSPPAVVVPQVAPQMAPTPEYKISGRVIGISLADDDHGGYMTDAVVRKLGSREFLVGKWPPFPDQEAFHGLVVWVPIDKIVQIMEFESMEKALESYKAHEEKAADALPRQSDPSS